MSDPSTAPAHEAGHDAAFPPPPAPTPQTPGVRQHPRPPRPGDLTVGWRAATAALWIGVVFAFAAVWGASVQLGLSTWWLGPRADPQPEFIRFSPFIVPVLVLLATINQVRWLPWIGLVAAAVTGTFGIGDLGRVNSLAAIELVIAAAAAAGSIASLTGTYRRSSAPVGEPAAEADTTLTR